MKRKWRDLFSIWYPYNFTYFPSCVSNTTGWLILLNVFLIYFSKIGLFSITKGMLNNLKWIVRSYLSTRFIYSLTYLTALWLFGSSLRIWFKASNKTQQLLCWFLDGRRRSRWNVSDPHRPFDIDCKCSFERERKMERWGGGGRLVKKIFFKVYRDKKIKHKTRTAAFRLNESSKRLKSQNENWGKSRDINLKKEIQVQEIW